MNSLFQKQGKQIQIYNFNFYAQHRPDSNRMILKSDLADAEIFGQYEFEDIGKATGRLLAHHLPAFRDIIKKYPDTEDESFNNFRYEFHLKNTYPITDFFFPEIEFARNSKIYGNYFPSSYEFNLEGDLPSFQYEDTKWDNLDISFVTNDTLAHFLITCGSMVSGSVINMENISLDWKLDNDSLYYNLLWRNKDPEDISMGNISGFASFMYRPSYKIPRMAIHLNPGRIFVRDTIWDLDRSTVTIDTSSVQFHRLRISHNTQSLAINGTLSKQPSDELHFNFTDLDLEHMNLVTSKSGLQLEGIMNGTTTISDVYNNPMFLSDIRIKHLFINKEELGNTFIRTRWINPEQKIRLEMEAMRGELKTLDIKGDYYPDNRKIDFNLTLDKLKLEIFEPYPRGVITDLDGLASGELRLDGYTDKPMVNGSLNLQKTSFRVDYLQTIYSFTNEIQVRDNSILFNDFEIFDEEGNRSVVQGTIKNSYFRDFEFDLSLRAENFNFMETRVVHNQTFYGNALASGLVRFIGEPGNLRLVVSAKTEKGTHIYIPINQGRDLQENNFITYIQPDSVVVVEEEVDPRYSVDLAGLSLDFDLEVTPDATVEIIFDPQVGDIMSANGSGNIQLTLDRQNDFEIFGEYVIDRGDYLFTLQNIINKRLSVQRGGRISWNGDPTGAIINMTAIYDTRAVPGVLVPEPTENLKKRMPVDCHLIMEGNLLNPLLSFKIEMPTAEEETRNIVRNAISTEEELTKQFLSLLVINNFSAPSTVSGGSGNTGAGMAGVTASELLSNQLSNWLSQISNDFDIGVNYRPGDEISSDQVEVALSTQIFDDRVSIHTNVDVSDKSSNTAANQRTNTIAGDFDVDVKLTDNGKFRLKAYNRYNYDQLYKTAPYTQGVGFLYREDFDSFGELGRRYFGGSKKKKKNKENKNVSENTSDSE
ncbi:MAG: translocation/assembly module TamB [Bacteroidales bacterium]|nr:translocation/assembly module TamB [Bacteroidales bacterium]